MVSTDIRRVAEQAAAWFQTRERENGDKFDSLRDNVPQWLLDAVHEAHGDMLPDDYVYGYARAAVDFIAENGDDEDLAHEFADDVDVYTSQLLDWYGSHSSRSAYVQEAREAGLVPDDSFVEITAQIAAGQHLERSHVYGAMLSAIREQAER